MAAIERSGNKVVEKWTADYFVYDLEFSPDGKYLLVAGSSGARLHDAQTWKSVWFSGDEGQ